MQFHLPFVISHITFNFTIRIHEQILTEAEKKLSTKTVNPHSVCEHKLDLQAANTYMTSEFCFKNFRFYFKKQLRCSSSYMLVFQFCKHSCAERSFVLSFIKCRITTQLLSSIHDCNFSSKLIN